MKVEVDVPNSPYGFCGRKATPNCSISELRSCVKVEVDVLGSPSLIVLMVSACGRKATLNCSLSELRSCVKVEVDVPNSPYGFCGRKASLNCSISELRSWVKVEVDVLGSPSLIGLRFLWT